ncbi:MAG: Ig-like domain-containing protein [Nitrospirota bacterium]
MKKVIIFILLAFALAAFSGCGGGGAGSSDTPKGENPGQPSVIQLLPSHFIAQTNSEITLHAKVLDGNGKGVSDVRVTFTNLSPVGILSSTTDKTNNIGVATVALKSTSSGFATIQVEVNKGVAIVRDRKTVFFTTSNISQLTPTLTLAVDGNDADTIFNENEDFNLLETAGDNSVLIMATLANAASFISGSEITFAADRPYRVGTDPDAECSDGSENCDVRFPAGVTAITDSSGEATTPVVLEPSSLTSIPTTLNILAQADVGACNIITLFIGPVTVQSPITVSANPTTVESGGTSTITAGVLTNAGTPVPDGTTVNFSVISGPGSVEPFAQTTDGIAEAEYSAPEVTSDTSATIRASAGGASGTVNVTVIAPAPEPAELAITPPSVSVIGAAPADTITFTISGGTVPYTTTSSDLNRAFNDNGAGGGIAGNGVRDGGEGGIWTGASIVVTIPAGAETGTVTLTVSDAASGTAAATIAVQ